MEIKIFDHFKTTEWSGGTTTEFFIYPQGSSYQSGNFKARISSATIELETSNFTVLPGVYRMLMVLEGQMQLTIGENAPISMNPHDICAFSGDLKTTSAGKVRDFNLMVKRNMRGDIQFLEITTKNIINFPRSFGKQFLVVYIIDGCGAINGHAVKQGEVVLLDDYMGEVCEFAASEANGMKMAVCRIWENGNNE